ncbi:O-methyltransferase-like protein [Emticicia oligotrophica DSM 17448]|uniref:O-methyltransferase-like protein n=1 Tax=Emticicia oligotrophica (strain DSM 17448 / CIP 109782 / MTCC 6937 / GPTSA100-15) TaxID=929562 RepID=A0ABN4ASB6_EMTOG|nr:class I SAM-dependent methyltransferase [Emticicia oligotrophica]AFK04886.1 O-methyltransferase-like protein [Emticicia oligotrophica DSM 17448]
MIFDYIKYLFKAKDEHSLHSPFLFDFYTRIVKDKTNYGVYSEIENLRKQALKDKRLINITDFGAGAKLNSNKQRMVKNIAKHSLKRPQLAKFLHRIISYYNYKNILDLGTSLGITTAYLAKANQDSQVNTFEGCAETANVAQENFDALSINNISLNVGNIDTLLPEVLQKIEKIDFAFFDANHRFEPTISYFEHCVGKIHEDSCFVFDDIYWSNEMKMAWDTIKKHPEVSISIDFFWIGIVFFRKKQPKQHFILKF